jgi:hypothetical protein
MSFAPRARRGLVRTFTIAMLASITTAFGSAATAESDLTVLSVDPYTNPSSYHRTQVEPDTYSYGSTIVGVFQVGRFQDGGASNIGWATTTDGGQTWSNGFLPGTTPYSTPPGPWDRISDPAVAYDAAHDVWLANSLALDATGGVSGEAVVVSRSTDGGLSFGNPIVIDEAGAFGYYDKNWIACDSWPQSPFFGRCYAQWDDFGSGNQLHMWTSTDGGLNWFRATTPNSSVLGGNPVALPNGRVVVPISNGFVGSQLSFVSTNGGVSYQGPFTISGISENLVDGNLRSLPLVTAEVDAGGRVYVAWYDCRFRPGCSSNDIVMTTSTDGQNWTPVVRVPIDPVTTDVDHFIPGLGVDATTSGGTARLGLTFYFYPDENCSSSTCKLNVGYVSSSNGGATWSRPVRLAGPMTNTWLPLTTSGYMVGDYISTSWTDEATAFPIISVARAGSCDLGAVRSCRQTSVTVTGGLPAGAGVIPAGLDRPVAGVRSERTSRVLLTAS